MISHLTVINDDFATTYQSLLKSIFDKPDYVTSPRGQLIKECIDVKFIVTNPYSNLFKNEIRSVPKQYLADELILYFNAENSADKFIRASKFWDAIKTQQNTINSAYGHLIFTTTSVDEQMTQYEWVISSLKQDKDSRQALMHFNKPQHQYFGNKDFVCTVSIQFFIRNDELHMKVYRRSQDMYFGLTYDFVWESLLMQHVLLDLQSLYPELKLGQYILDIGSAHIYERNFNLIENMLKYSFVEDELPKVTKSHIFNPVNSTELGDWIAENCS